jgi:hypothetical protein
VLLAVAAAALIGAGSGVRRWIVGLAALAIAGWLASLALSVLRKR